MNDLKIMGLKKLLIDNEIINEELFIKCNILENMNKQAEEFDDIDLVNLLGKRIYDMKWEIGNLIMQYIKENQ